MKRLIVALVLAAVLIPTAHVVARDTTRNPLNVAEEGWSLQQTPDSKNPVTTGGDVFQIPKNPVIVAEEGWQVQQTTEPKNPVTTDGDVFQIPKNNPSQTPRGFYPIPELGEPIP